jgi:hypothetical protein
MVAEISPSTKAVGFWSAALWAVTFPGATWSLAILFRRAATSATGPRAPGA